MDAVYGYFLSLPSVFQDWVFVATAAFLESGVCRNGACGACVCVCVYVYACVIVFVVRRCCACAVGLTSPHHTPHQHLPPPLIPPPLPPSHAPHHTNLLLRPTHHHHPHYHPRPRTSRVNTAQQQNQLPSLRMVTPNPDQPPTTWATKLALRVSSTDNSVPADAGPGASRTCHRMLRFAIFVE